MNSFWVFVNNYAHYHFLFFFCFLLDQKATKSQGFGYFNVKVICL
jgi:hypothetical protein